MSLTAQQVIYLDKTPVSTQGTFRRALSGEASPRQAIKAKCLDCCSYIREDIKCCAVEVCSLWRYRPFQKKSGEDEMA